MEDTGDAIYRERSARYYDCIATGLKGDVAFYVEEAQKAGSPVLELGCGTGRVTLPVAQAGVEIVGLDMAPSMLAIARNKVASLDAETAGRITLVEGDMRTFALDQRFGLIFIPFRAFAHLLTSEDQRRALGCIRNHLTEDGKLALNLFDPSHALIAAHSGSLGQAQVKIGDFDDPVTGHHVIVWESRKYGLELQTVTVERIFEACDVSGQAVSRTYGGFTLRYLHRYEMEYLLELCGFEVEALYGDFARGPFRHGIEQIWIARKRS